MSIILGFCISDAVLFVCASTVWNFWGMMLIWFCYWRSLVLSEHLESKHCFHLWMIVKEQLILVKFEILSTGIQPLFVILLIDVWLIVAINRCSISAITLCFVSFVSLIVRILHISGLFLAEQTFEWRQVCVYSMKTFGTIQRLKKLWYNRIKRRWTIWLHCYRLGYDEICAGFVIFFIAFSKFNEKNLITVSCICHTCYA